MNTLTTVRPRFADFQQAGVLGPADVHTAADVCRLAGETDEQVMLALALAVRALRQGSVCLELDRLSEVGVDDGASGDAAAGLAWPDPDELLAKLQASPLAAGGPSGPLRPLTLADSEAGWMLYLDRYFRQEQLIRRVLAERESSRPVVDPSAAAAVLGELFVDPAGSGAPAPDRQRIAAAVAATEWTTVVAGGPGTGKTHTVARILALLYRLSGPGLRVALAAPTGKAAAALSEAVAEQAGALGLPGELAAITLHRLLGWRRGSRSRFRHDARNRLPYDVVVVDETSMVSLTIMARLFEALSPSTRLILMGDPDQLTSVDAGAVMADLVERRVERGENMQLVEIVADDLGLQGDSDGGGAPSEAGQGADVRAPSEGAPGEPQLNDDERAALSRGLVRLRRGHRFNGAIGELADAVRRGDVKATLAVLGSGGDAVSLHAPTDLGAVRDAVASSAAHLISAAQSGDAPAALGALTQHRLLCAHREGPYGQRHWADRAVEWTIARVGQALEPSEFYPGQPLLITANDYQTGVYNGDIGVVVATGDGVMAAIERGQVPLLIHPNVLSSVQTAYAMTIHRSQGSQYRGVSVILPEPDSPLLSRQLLYTAITRARDQVRIIATEDAVAAAVTRQIRRASGLPLALREAGGEAPELGHKCCREVTGYRDPVVDEATVVERATANRPHARYQSVDDFSDAVERAIRESDTKRESAEDTACRLLKRIRLPKPADEDLHELLKWALALDENSVDDMKALTRVIPRLSNKAINRLWKINRDGLVRVYARYAGYVESRASEFPFKVCDAIADFASRAVERTKDHRILRATLTSLTAMGYRHQRWHVREVVTTILQSIRKPEDAVAAVEALRAADIYAVRWVLEDFSLPSLDPRLRDGVMALLDDSVTG